MGQLIKCRTTIALRCPECGQMEAEEVSLFLALHPNGYESSCRTCNVPKGTLYIRNNKVVSVQVFCAFCGNPHFYEIPLSDILDEELHVLYCSETDLEIGFVGFRDGVIEAIEEQEGDFGRLMEVLEEIGFEDYFERPDIMFEIMSTLHNLAEEGKMRCECGHQRIQVELFPDRLELCCASCKGRLIVPGEKQADLARIRSLSELVLNEGTVTAVSALKKKSTRRKR